MLRRFWLFFAQAVTVLLALMFIVATLKPQWLQRQGQLGKQLAAPIVALREVTPGVAGAPAQTSYADAAQKAMPAVVNVFSSKDGSLPPDPRAKDPLFRYFFGDRNPRRQQEEPASNLGSGVIVSPEGYILTNQHVVLAIGNPFGVGQTVTMGIISALGRNHLGINTFENFIQTDAPINPGNSGGALVDVNGNLLGINTAIYSRSGGSLGIGFAIPVSTARTVLESIITTGTVTRGWIGVEPQDVTPEIADSFGLAQKTGAIVAGVLQGGPADKAGIKPGDILTTVNDEPITDTTKLLNVVAQIKPGTPTKVQVVRKTRTFDVTVVIGKRPPPPKQANEIGRAHV